jgi:hypothetical protein
MSGRRQIRRVPQGALGRFWAVVIIALVLCPFTAPFASYDPNGSVIGFLAQDGSLLDKACEKAVSTGLPVAVFRFVHLGTLITTAKVSTPVDLLLQRSMVLRV